jgi:multisubunit Na+/H+ antiporter MnhG subunit
VASDRAIRFRLLTLAFVVAALWLGLWRYEVWLPDVHPKYISATLEVISQYVGAIFGAAMVFIAFAFVKPRFSREGLAAVVLLLLCAVELSQLYPASWVGDFRTTWLGGLIWGNGFRWSHLVCYAIGVIPLAEEQEFPALGRLFVTLLCLGCLIGLWRFARS